jgi:hypothetical protein
MAFEYNVTDEGIIHFPREIVWEAFMDELDGARNWWLPFWEADPVGEVPVSRPGGEFKATVHPPSRLLQLLFTPRFTVRMLELEAPKRFRVEFPEGHFRGIGTFDFMSLGECETRVRFNWNVTTHGIRPAFAAMFVNLGSIHSKIVQGGYRGLNEWLESNVPASHAGRPHFVNRPQRQSLARDEEQN